MARRSVTVSTATPTAKLTATLTATAVLAAGWAGAAGAEVRRAAVPWRPVVMAALGDSISAGFNVCGWYVSCTSRSWAAGDHAEVLSHYLRLLARDEAVEGHNVNLAVPGATSADLSGQMTRAVARRADYVTVLIGAQDACVPEERRMTPVPVYRARVAAALRLLKERRPGARVFLASIPDLKRLWRVGRGNAAARGFWTVGRICPTMLARPASTAPADRARRDRVRARVAAYNRALADVCAEYGRACRFDGGAVFRHPFTLDHVSGWDFFHPNAAGQRLIAKTTFAAARGWLDEPAGRR
ncbi:lipoprotein [Planomonospora parontospora subsp. parontospora]|uniref:Lipoprotein n=2 Tax=Planomonospora parontospora TaxID=58119 RepID=A0AA37F663_9ACTN|nr:lipoprotein [Planomonospora parontospora]GII10963.1 lipoprotein [Planomonospora parontospora subsp. parontospora]